MRNCTLGIRVLTKGMIGKQNINQTVDVEVLNKTVDSVKGDERK